MVTGILDRIRHGFQAADLLKIGPKGYIHGWIFVGAPGVGAHVFHPKHGAGRVSHHDEHGHVHVTFDSGKTRSFAHNGAAGGAGALGRRKDVAGGHDKFSQHLAAASTANRRKDYQAAADSYRRAATETSHPKIRAEMHGRADTALGKIPAGAGRTPTSREFAVTDASGAAHNLGQLIRHDDPTAAKKLHVLRDDLRAGKVDPAQAANEFERIAAEHPGDTHAHWQLATAAAGMRGDRHYGHIMAPPSKPGRTPRKTVPKPPAVRDVPARPGVSNVPMTDIKAGDVLRSPRGNATVSAVEQDGDRIKVVTDRGTFRGDPASTFPRFDNVTPPAPARDTAPAAGRVLPNGYSVAALKDGDYARISGHDQYGSPTTWEGYVQGRPGSPVRGKGKKGVPQLAVNMEAERRSISGARGVVYAAPDAVTEMPTRREHGGFPSHNDLNDQAATAHEALAKDLREIADGHRRGDAPDRASRADNAATVHEKLAAQHRGVISSRDVPPTPDVERPKPVESVTPQSKHAEHLADAVVALQAGDRAKAINHLMVAAQHAPTPAEAQHARDRHTALAAGEMGVPVPKDVARRLAGGGPTYVAPRPTGTAARPTTHVGHLRAAEDADIEAAKELERRNKLDADIRNGRIAGGDRPRRGNEVLGSVGTALGRLRGHDETIAAHRRKAEQHRSAAAQILTAGATPEDRASKAELKGMAAQALAAGDHERAAQLYERVAARSRGGDTGWTLERGSKGWHFSGGEKKTQYSETFGSRKAAEDWRTHAAESQAQDAEFKAAEARRAAAKAATPPQPAVPDGAHKPSTIRPMASIAPRPSDNAGRIGDLVAYGNDSDGYHIHQVVGANGAGTIHELHDPSTGRRFPPQPGNQQMVVPAENLTAAEQAAAALAGRRFGTVDEVRAAVSPHLAVPGPGDRVPDVVPPPAKLSRSPKIRALQIAHNDLLPLAVNSGVVQPNGDNLGRYNEGLRQRLKTLSDEQLNALADHSRSIRVKDMGGQEEEHRELGHALNDERVDRRRAARAAAERLKPPEPPATDITPPPAPPVRVVAEHATPNEGGGHNPVLGAHKPPSWVHDAPNLDLPPVDRNAPKSNQGIHISPGDIVSVGQRGERTYAGQDNRAVWSVLNVHPDRGTVHVVSHGSPNADGWSYNKTWGTAKRRAAIQKEWPISGLHHEESVTDQEYRRVENLGTRSKDDKIHQEFMSHPAPVREALTARANEVSKELRPEAANAAWRHTLDEHNRNEMIRHALRTVPGANKYQVTHTYDDNGDELYRFNPREKGNYSVRPFTVIPVNRKEDHGVRDDEKRQWTTFASNENGGMSRRYAHAVPFAEAVNAAINNDHTLTRGNPLSDMRRLRSRDKYAPVPTLEPFTSAKTPLSAEATRVPGPVSEPGFVDRVKDADLPTSVRAQPEVNHDRIRRLSGPDLEQEYGVESRHDVHSPVSVALRDERTRRALERDAATRTRRAARTATVRSKPGATPPASGEFVEGKDYFRYGTASDAPGTPPIMRTIEQIGGGPRHRVIDVDRRDGTVQPVSEHDDLASAQAAVTAAHEKARTAGILRDKAGNPIGSPEPSGVSPTVKPVETPNPTASADHPQRVVPPPATTATPKAPAGKPRKPGEARRGDLLVTEHTRRDSVIGQPTRETQEYEVHRVASVNRDGVATTAHNLARDLDGSPQVTTDKHGILRNGASPVTRRWIVPKETVDAVGVRAALQAHTYPGHTFPRAHEDLGAVQALLKPHTTGAGATARDIPDSDNAAYEKASKRIRAAGDITAQRRQLDAELARADLPAGARAKLEDIKTQDAARQAARAANDPARQRADRAKAEVDDTNRIMATPVDRTPDGMRRLADDMGLTVNTVGTGEQMHSQFFTSSPGAYGTPQKVASYQAWNDKWSSANGSPVTQEQALAHMGEWVKNPKGDVLHTQYEADRKFRTARGEDVADRELSDAVARSSRLWAELQARQQKSGQ